MMRMGDAVQKITLKHVQGKKGRGIICTGVEKGAIVVKYRNHIHRLDECCVRLVLRSDELAELVLVYSL